MACVTVLVFWSQIFLQSLIFHYYFIAMLLAYPIYVCLISDCASYKSGPPPFQWTPSELWWLSRGWEGKFADHLLLLLQQVVLVLVLKCDSWWEQSIEWWGVYWRPRVAGVINRSEWTDQCRAGLGGWRQGRCPHWGRWNRYASETVSQVTNQIR